MASNINPSLTPVNSLDNFRFWCQKVLPLVYDDSLSYYEVLGKMVVQLNDVIDNVNADTENVLTLKDAFLELQTYVNNFFDDIDQLASYAERAEAAQTAANTSAVNAATSASNASQSSLAAMDARDTAVAARQAAQASANTASTAATNANTKANEAAQSAITAQTAQASASQSATLTATDRSAAQTAANTATTKANEANTSATNAETSAENAAQSEANAEELVNNIQENLDNIQQNTQDISELKESVSKKLIITQDDIEQGNWKGMIKSSNAQERRLRIKAPFRCSKGTIVKSTGANTNLIFNLAVFPNRYSPVSEVLDNTSFAFSEYTIQNDGWLVLVIKDRNDTASAPINITPSDYINYQLEITIFNSVDIVEKDSYFLPDIHGKTVAFLGDSMTAGSGYTESYFMYLAQRFGLVCKNYGYGGCGYGYSNPSKSGYVGTGQETKGVLVTTSTKIVPNDFLSRISSISESEIDALVIFGGVTNDWNLGGYSVEQFKTHVKSVFDYVQTNFANIPVFVLSSPKRTNELEDGEYVKNSGDAYFYELINALKEVCEEYAIKFIDVYHDSGINPHQTGTNTYFFIRSDNNNNDGVHVNNNAHKRIAALLANSLVTMLSNWNY